MRITTDTVRQIIELTRETNSLTWYKSEGIPCFDCEYEGKSVIICRYEERYGTVVLLTFTDDWGTIVSEIRFNKNDEFFEELSSLYDFIDENATVELA